MPLVSVIMGVYNVGSYKKLKRAIDSILNQSFQDFEFIICDDGSNDKTFLYLKQLASEEHKIFIIRHEENKGLAASLNDCIKYCSGQYIARQDADDYSLENRLDLQIKYLQENKEISYVGTAIKLFDEANFWGKLSFPEKPNNKDFLWKSPYCHGSVMFRKKALEKVNGYKVSKITRRCEDYDLFIRLFLNKCYGANLEIPLYCYCENKQSLYRRKFIYRIDDFVLRIKYFGKLGVYPLGIIFLFKPLIVGLIPKNMLNFFKDKIYSRRI